MATTKAAGKHVRSRGPEKREKYIGLRMTPSEYEQISARAQKLRITLTELLVKSALGELQSLSTVDERFADLERRIVDLERAADLGGFG